MFKCEYCGKDDFETQKQLAGHNMTCKPKHTERKVTRENRVPFGVMEQRFSDVPKNDGFKYHVFNDNWQKDPGRVERALNAGYERVEHVNSGKTVGTNDDGTQIKGVLMRIPKEWHEEDKAKREEKLLETENQITQGTHLRQKGDGRYIPRPGGTEQGTSITSKTTP